MIERKDGSSWNAGNEVSLADVVAHLQVIKFVEGLCYHALLSLHILVAAPLQNCSDCS